MSDARSTILSAVSSALERRRGGSPRGEGATMAAEAERLRARADATRPDRLRGGPETAFLERLVSAAVAASAERVAQLGEFPAAVRRYLTAQGLASSVALQPHPDLLALDWSEIETHGQLSLDEQIGRAHV